MGMDVYGNAPTNEAGKYFRASVWGWRPIFCLIEEANTRYGLGLNTEGFADNGGSGLSTQAECDRLADALVKLVAENPFPTFDLDVEAGGVEGAVMAQLVAAGWSVRPPSGPQYRVTVEQVEEFIDFLRGSGGFKIW